MINEESFTQGPWQKCCGGRFVAADNRKGGVIIAEVHKLPNGEGCADSNASLIAAAPDMYEALTKIYEAIDPHSHGAEKLLCETVLRKALGRS